jgi:predicted RNase H-like HicB family nuclease
VSEENTADLTPAEMFHLIMKRLEILETFAEDRSRDTRPLLETIHKEIAGMREDIRKIEREETMEADLERTLRFRERVLKHLVRLDPDVAEVFKSPEEVNEALRRVMREQGDAMMQRINVTPNVFQEGDHFVAQCREYGIAAQGKTEHDALFNLSAALTRHLKAPVSIKHKTIPVDSAELLRRHNLARLDPEIVEHFKTAEAINEALRGVMRERQGGAAK